MKAGGRLDDREGEFYYDQVTAVSVGRHAGLEAVGRPVIRETSSRIHTQTAVSETLVLLTVTK